MLNRLRLLAFATLFSLVTILTPIFSTSASAVSSGPSFTTSPVSLDLAVHPGSSATRTLQIMNNTAQPVPIVMKVDTFGAYGAAGQAQITTPGATDASPSYAHFSPASFIAQPKVWSLVQMTIKLPPTASLGYYLAIVFQPNTPNPVVPPGENIFKGANSILVLIDTQSTNETRRIEVGQFSSNKGLFEYLPVSFSVTIHNSGNIFLNPSGNIYISRNANLTHTISTLIVNPAGGNVLPNSNRVFNLSWSNGFPVFQDKLVNGNTVLDKKGVPIEQLKWNLANAKDFRFGKYYAGLTLTYNNGTKIVALTAVVSFWVIPWKLLLVSLLVILIIGYAFWVLGRGLYRRVRKVSTKAKHRINRNRTKI